MGEADGMRTKITQRARPRQFSILTPAKRDLRVGQKILVEDTPEEGNLAQLPFFDELLGERLCRVFEVIEAHNAGDPGFFHRRDNTRGIRGCICERFFTVDMFPRFGCGNRHFGMKVIGGRDIHKVHIGIFNNLPPIYRPAGKSKVLSPRFYRIRVHVCDNFQPRSGWFIAKNEWDIFEGYRVGFAHHSGSDQANSYFFHGLSHLQQVSILSHV